MNESQISQNNSSSLEEHLTNSIRRAKERIYNNAVSNYSIGSQFTISQLHQNTPHFQIRNRTNSQRNNLSSSQYKQEKSILASAMRTLQEKIVQLQRQNKQLLLKNREAQSNKEKGRRREQTESSQLSQLLASLRERQHEIKKLTKDKNELNERNAYLTQRLQELQGQIQRLISQKVNNYNQERGNQQSEVINRTEFFQKQLKIKELEAKIAQIQQKTKNDSQTIQQLTKKVDNQKKLNMKWIKMHEQQFLEGEHKQNNSLDVNNQVNQTGIRNINKNKKNQVTDLQKKNKEMYELIQRNKLKITDLTKQCKKYQERFNQMKDIALQIVQNVNKMVPHQSSHIKYLTTKILKLQNSHLQSLRSYSNHIRKSRVFQRNNSNSKQSKQRKRSLKMEDLNSSAKKSRERSQSKSHKKRKINEQQILKSEKKNHFAKQQEQIQELQKQVLMLKKKYRNFIAKAQTDKNNTEVAKKIDDTANQYNQKKAKLQQMKQNMQLKIRKDQPLAKN